MTPSMSSILYNKFQKRCKRFISDGNAVIGPIARNVLKILNNYLPGVATYQAKSAQIFDPHFPNDLLHDPDILRRYVVSHIVEKVGVGPTRASKLRCHSANWVLSPFSYSCHSRLRSATQLYIWGKGIQRVVFKSFPRIF